MFHLEKVFGAGNPLLALEGLQSIAKTGWLKFLFANNKWSRCSANFVAQALHNNGFGEWDPELLVNKSIKKSSTR